MARFSWLRIATFRPAFTPARSHAFSRSGLGFSAEKIALMRAMSPADLADFGAKPADIDAFAEDHAGGGKRR
jgi:hypothetical protein